MEQCKLVSESNQISLECSICLADFIKPKQLPCLHTFCLECLKQECKDETDGDKKPCPLCRREYEIPRGGVDMLPYNELIARLILEKELRKRCKKPTSCDLCVEIGEQIRADGFCMVCRQQLCELCRKRHLKQKVSSLHKIVGMDEKVSEEALMILRICHCNIHDNKELELYCLDCSKLICVLCHATEHSKHKCRTSSEIAREKKCEAVRDRVALERCLEENKNKQRKRKDIRNRFQKQLALSLSDIEGCSDILILVTQFVLKQLVEKHTDIAKKELKKMETDKDSDDLHYTALESFSAYSRMVMSRGTDIEIIKAADNLHNTALELIATQEKHNKQVLHQPTISFLRASPPTAEEILQLMGHLLYSGAGNVAETESKEYKVRANYRGNPKVIESILTLLLGALKSHAPDRHQQIVNELEEMLRKLCVTLSDASAKLQVNGSSSDEKLVESEYKGYVKGTAELITNNDIYLSLQSAIREIISELEDQLTTADNEKRKLADRLTRADNEKSKLEEEMKYMPIDVNFLKRLGIKKTIMTIGLNTGPSTERKICEIRLEQRDTVNVINSTPAYVPTESAACVVNNTLYAVGLGMAYNEVWAWSAMKDEWTRCADLTSGRRRHCVTPVGDTIYVLGGWRHEGEVTLDDILCYDINSNTWTEASAKLRHAVWGATCLTYKHRVYVFGGATKDNNSAQYVQVYDTWTSQVSFSCNPMPAAANLMRAALWRSKALLIGCYTCYIYDFETDKWQERTRFKTDVAHFGLTLDENTLYISGGGKSSRYADNKLTWTCRDDVMSLSVNNFISNNVKAQWRCHAKLPAPALISSYSPETLYKL